MNDHTLRDAVRALRDEAQGSSDAADATRMRVLGTVRARRRRAVMIVRATAVLLAAAFGGVAWAAATGRLPPLSALFADDSNTNSIPEAPGPSGGVPAAGQLAPSTPVVRGDSTPPQGLPSPATAPTATVRVDSAPEVKSGSRGAANGAKGATGPAPSSAVAAPSGAPDSAGSSMVPAPSATATSGAGTAEPSGADASADALYQRAHSLHFQAGNWAAARAAWDAYLAAAPGGRFATFAHYNRALCLLRLGQTGEARRVLSLFAAGAFGGYRRAEAQSLLDALDAVKTDSGAGQ